MSFYLKKYMWLVSLLAVAVCSYFLARMTANMIALGLEGEGGVVSLPASSKKEAPPPEKGMGEEEVLGPVIERNIFDSRAVAAAQTGPGEGEPTEEEMASMTGEAQPTSLKIKLISTFSVGEGTDNRSSCIVSPEGAGDKEVYTVNDEKQFAPDTRIVRILYDRVEFIHRSRLEYVVLEDFSKGVSLNVPPRQEEPGPTAQREEKKEPAIERKGEGAFVIDRAEVDEAIANLDKLYTEIRAVPHFQEGKPNGLKLLSVRSGSIFAKLGLQRGDILQRINGLDLDIKRGLEIFNQLKNENRVTIDLERRGSKQTLDYEIR